MFRKKEKKKHNQIREYNIVFLIRICVYTRWLLGKTVQKKKKIIEMN